MSKLSVIIITLNEERHIANCLKSVEWADEIIVVDSQSTDRTVDIAKEYTEKVFINEWLGYSENKNIALGHASNEWVLWLDADESVTPELAREIQELLKTKPEENGFVMSRRAYFLGKWIKHCGWYPDYVMRLFRREKGVFNDNRVHEGVQLEGSIKRLNHDLLHFTDDSLEHYLWKFNRYTSLAAEEQVKRKKRSGLFKILFRPLHTWLKMYIFKLGFLDGVQGFILCSLSAGYVAVKYAKTWELDRKLEKDSSGGNNK